MVTTFILVYLFLCRVLTWKQIWGYVVAISIEDRLKYLSFSMSEKGPTWISECHNKLMIANKAGIYQVSNSLLVISYCVIIFQENI